MKKHNEPLRPCEICLGNFIESMGKIEIVTGILKQDGDIFKIAHGGWHKGESVIPDDVIYNDEWKKCFGIDKYELPDWIKFVHEVQNYFMYALRLNLLEIMDWDLLPQTAEIKIDE